MSYLSSTSVVVDAILTKKGRELLARNDGSFRITQFSLSDDEVDYTLYNPNHPSGSAFYGEAIEAMPLWLHRRRPIQKDGLDCTKCNPPRRLTKRIV